MEASQPKDGISAILHKFSGVGEGSKVKGRFVAQCFDKDGNLKWEDTIDNTVVTVGKNLELDTLLAGSAYTTVGPFMGLISSVGWSAIDPADTMASHAGWTEAGPTNAPDYSGDRKTCAFDAAAAGVKALTSALAFTFSEGGTVKGAFVVTGTGAVNTHDDTNGVLYSAGLFTGGDKVVASTDVLNVSWQVTLT